MAKLENTFFDIRVTNTNANSQNHLSATSVVKRHEKEKKIWYNNRVMDIEHGTFTPLASSVSRSVGKECSVFHKHMAQKIANKTDARYEEIMPIIRCTLSFLILWSCSMYIRRRRSPPKPELVDNCTIVPTIVPNVFEWSNIKVEEHSF